MDITISRYQTKLAGRPAAARDHGGCSSVLYALQSRPSGARANCTVGLGGCVGGHGLVILIDSLWGPKTRSTPSFVRGLYTCHGQPISLPHPLKSEREQRAPSRFSSGKRRNKTFGRGMGHPGANPFANGFVIAAAMALVVDSGGQLDWCPPRRPKLTTSQLSGPRAPFR